MAELEGSDANLSSLGTNPPARLYTTFGTVLYVDRVTGELLHGSAEASPPNAWLRPIAEHRPGEVITRVTIVGRDNGDESGVVCGPDGCRAFAGSQDSHRSGGTDLQLVRLERGLFALQGNGVFLCATPDGRVLLSRPVCSTWECFLASEDWCGADPVRDRDGVEIHNASIAVRDIKKHIIDPRLRVRAEASSARKKVLIHGYTKWSQGRVYYEISKRLRANGYLVDILDWRVNHADYINTLTAYYDLLLTSPDGVPTLSDRYSVPIEKIVVVSHSEFETKQLIEEKGQSIFDGFAGYGVVSHEVYRSSLMHGVRRLPAVVSLGVDCAEFGLEPPRRLATVGYASSMSLTVDGVELKRGRLAESAAKAAGLNFRIAGSTRHQISYHDMPDFYGEVDAVLFTSINESAGLPVIEAAAAGRLVIGTPVGHFPIKAYAGGGLIAPIEPQKFAAFATSTLAYFRDRPAEFAETCRSIQEAASQFDWRYAIPDWLDLIDSARA